MRIQRTEMLFFIGMAAITLANVAVGAEVTREEFDELREHVQRQAEVIGRLRARITVMEKQVRKLRGSRSGQDGKSEAGKSEEAADQASGNMVRVPTDQNQWSEWHYLEYHWQKRKGWHVVQGQEKGAAKLVASKQARWSSLRHERELKGDFAAILTVMTPDDGWIELAQGKKSKRGFSVHVPTGRPAHVKIRREDGQLSATVNDGPVEVDEKHYGGQPDQPVQLALVVKRGGVMYLRDVELFVRQGTE